MLIGGSQAETSRGFTHGFFHDGTVSTQFTPKKEYYLRILPAFDQSKVGTPEYKESWVPYRDRELPEDIATKTPGFTSWYFVVQGYTFFGRGTHSLLSPLSYPTKGSRSGIDPIFDIRNYCRKSEDPNLVALVDDKASKGSPPVPNARYYVLVNTLMMTDMTSRNTENQIGIFTNAAWNDFKGKLALRAGRGDEVISADWEDFLYGDITHPEQALAVRVKEATMESNPNIKFAGMFLSNVDGRLDGHQKWSITDTEDSGKSVLQSRYEIGDMDNVTKIWTYDEMLDLVVQDGVVPYDVIERACAPYAPNGIPSQSSSSKSADYSIPSNDVSPSNSLSPAPAAAAPAPAATAPAPAATAPAPSEPAPSSEETATPVAEAVKVEPAASTEAGSEAEKARYEELATKFRESPSNLDPSELPEFFNLCSKLGVSPT